MYYISDDIKRVCPDVPYWYDQLGSFDPNQVLKHGFDAKYLASEQVRCEPLADVLSRNDIKQIDLLHIDVEGYEFEVIKQLDLSQPPRAILYENMHLSDTDKIMAEKLLVDAGYRVRRLLKDTLAISPRRPRSRNNARSRG
jgi:hypothetical protein